MKDNISKGFISIMESDCTISVDTFDLQIFLCQHNVEHSWEHKLKALKFDLTIVCSQMLSCPCIFPIFSICADLDATWTSFANLAISRKISSALAELPITTTTCNFNCCLFSPCTLNTCFITILTHISVILMAMKHIIVILFLPFSFSFLFQIYTVETCSLDVIIEEAYFPGTVLLYI